MIKIRMEKFTGYKILENVKPLIRRDMQTHKQGEYLNNLLLKYKNHRISIKYI